MGLSFGYGASENYKAKSNKKQRRGVFELLRPKSAYEVNHYQKTPYTERLCLCGVKAGDHWYLPTCDVRLLAKLWCRKDMTRHFVEWIKV